MKIILLINLYIILIINTFISSLNYNDLNEIRNVTLLYLQQGKYIDIISIINELEILNHGIINLDDELPSFSSIVGVAYHGLHNHSQAEFLFNQSINHNKYDSRSWINLGETQLLQQKFSQSIESFNQALLLGDLTALPRVISSNAWCNKYDSNYEYLISLYEKESINCYYYPSKCSIDSSIALEYTNVPYNVQINLQSKAPLSQESILPIKSNKITNINKKSKKKRLKVGLISSDFGIHPVSSLIRGMIQLIDKKTIELYAFAINNEMSWWSYNISESIEHFIILNQLNTIDSAIFIASKHIDILIDLNGHTKNSGLPILSHKPAPIQLSYLGSPTTTAASFIHYYLADYVVIPPEQAKQFTEKLVLLPPSYLVNDYILTQGDVVKHFSNDNRLHKSSLLSSKPFKTNQFLFGVLSNSQKITLDMIHVWYNILRGFGYQSQIIFLNFASLNCSYNNYLSIAKYSGISTNRIAYMNLSNWQDHLVHKTAIDIILDTYNKNGHTSGLDALWAGIPFISLGGSKSMSKRASESMYKALDNEINLVYSFKEYEDLIYAYSYKKRNKVTNKDISKNDVVKTCSNIYLSNDLNDIDICYYKTSQYLTNLTGYDKLTIIRNHLQSLRAKSALFDITLWVNRFTNILLSTFDISRLSIRRHKRINHYHIFAKVTNNSHVYDKPIYVYDSINHSTSDLFYIKNAEYAVVLSNRHKYLSNHSTSNTNNITKNKNKNEKKENKEGEDDNIKVTARVAAVDSKSYNSLPADLFSRDELIMLNIGGMVSQPGWLNVNAKYDTPYGSSSKIDIIRNMYDLEGFPNNSVAVIYSSHTLEHSGIGDGTLFRTLEEWKRVLLPGGLVMISVPNLRAIFKLYLDDSISISERWMATLMIYGAQTDEFDYHLIGFDEYTLTVILNQVGYCNITRVGSFNLFSDTSDMIYHNYTISLNMIARKCPDSSIDNDIEINHHAEPYDRSTSN